MTSENEDNNHGDTPGTEDTPATDPTLGGEKNPVQDLPEHSESSQTDHSEPSEPVTGSSRAEREEASKPKTESAEPNYEEGKPARTEATEEDVKRGARHFLDGLFMLMERPKEASDAISQMTSKELLGTKEENRKYRDGIQHAFRHHPDVQFDGFTPFDRDDSYWRQGVDHNGEMIAAAKPRISRRDGRLSGEAAALRMRAAAGLGTIINTPLWHTGIWLKQKAPSESALLELDRRIANEKVDLGRLTVGMAFTNTSVYINGFLIDLVINHLYGGTVKDMSSQYLKSIIKITDIPQMIWGVMCAIYPNGYRLVQPCVHNPDECNHIDEAHVNISKLSWVDNRSLSNEQRNLMSKRDAPRTAEQLEQYDQGHLAPQHWTIELNEDMTVRLAVPTIEEYEESGYRWVDGIVRMADEAFGHDLRGEERNEYIMQQGAVSNLRRYAHWIKSIEFSDGATVDDPEDIDQSLEALTADADLRNHLLKEVEKFIRSCVVNAIGIPRYTCPQCNGEPDEQDIPENLQEIIQLEVNELFFTLLSMRVQNIMQSD